MAKETKSTESKSITKGDALQLYNVLASSKGGSLERNEKVKLIILRSKLSTISEEREKLVESN